MKTKPSKKFTKIDYTLEQFMEEKKRNENVIKTLDKMASVMEKFESFSILMDYKIKHLEKYSTDLGVRLQKLEKKVGKK